MTVSSKRARVMRGRHALHVFTPALVHRLKYPECTVPVMAVRPESLGYQVMYLYERVELTGPSVLEPMYHDPLPGTNGRGVAISFTDDPVRCWGFLGQAVFTGADRKPDDVLAHVLRLFAEREASLLRRRLAAGGSA